MIKKKIFLLLTIALLSIFSTAEAKVFIDLSAPALKKIPIAVQDFKNLGTEPVSPEEAARIRNELLDALTSDIRFTNLFTILDKASFLEDAQKAGLAPEEINFKDWRTIGADTLVKGGFTVEKDKLTVEIRFFDCIKEVQLVGKKYIGSAKNPRRVIHYFADQVYEELTGRRGIYTTKLLFASDKGGNKEIFVADFDGKNATQITRNRSINLSPQWSPDGSRMLYVSYKKGTPSLYMLDLKTGKDTVISAKPGINIGGRFSPDGTKIALTLSIDRSAELYLFDFNTNEYKRLTDNYGIDVSPSWSPDGTKLAFVSDTSGNPHIFVLDLPTGNLKRLTFNGKYNSSPAWSPDGKTIAFSRSDSGRFNIWVMRPDGSNLTQITFEGNNRSPSWSPDSRYIVYSYTSRGNSSLFIMQADGSGQQKLDTGIGNEKSPAWSPFIQ
ncbi:MAG: Tol-Pal system beta propeller repeat protein TolB [Deltaproteobacteria bacterium]|nr:Tol-Pal system beta propeller repeat protein TolB [Deltaproteobacteria bacterium]